MPKTCNFNIRADDPHWGRQKRAHVAKQNVYNVKRKRRQGVNTPAATAARVRTTYRQVRHNQCNGKKTKNYVSCHTRKNGAIKVKAYCRKNHS